MGIIDHSMGEMSVRQGRECHYRAPDHSMGSSPGRSATLRFRDGAITTAIITAVVASTVQVTVQMSDGGCCAHRNAHVQDR